MIGLLLLEDFILWKENLQTKVVKIYLQWKGNEGSSLEQSEKYCIPAANYFGGF